MGTDKRTMLAAMRRALEHGENMLAAARSALGSDVNDPEAIRYAYDEQAGTYIEKVRADPEVYARWFRQVAGCVRPYLPPGGSILEVGSGDATTLAGVLKELGDAVGHAMGCDVSPKRVAVGQAWLRAQGVTATTFVGDLFALDLPDASVDVVYTSHSLEPNGGREAEAIRELLRVARHALVLIEPLYELASPEAQARMKEHGYVRGLRDAATGLGAQVREYRLLPVSLNPMNPIGVLVLV
jgi:SAM-dependent methyltransferase